jgi:hypothetical protein
MEMFVIDKITFNVQPHLQATLADINDLITEFNFNHKDFEVSIINTGNKIVALQIKADTYFNFDNIKQLLDYINSKTDERMYDPEPYDENLFF